MNYTELSQLTKKFDKRHYLWSSICGVKSKKYTRKACLLGFEKKKKKKRKTTNNVHLIKMGKVKTNCITGCKEKKKVIIEIRLRYALKVRVSNRMVTY